MNDKNHYNNLVQERDRVLAELAIRNPELSGELKVILRLMEKFNTSDDVTITKENISATPSKLQVVGEVDIEKINKVVVKPTRLIKMVFAENPDKTFSPPEIRDWILKFVAEGLTVVKGKRILTTAHTIIIGLLKQNYIEKIVEYEGADPEYKLKQN